MPVRCYRFRLYPSKAQEELLLWNLEVCRWTYNKLLELKQNQHLGHRKLQALLVLLKKDYPQLSEVNAKVLQMVNNRLHYNVHILAELKKQGHKVGKLRFKGRGRYKTLTFNQSGFRVDGKKLVLSKIGGISIKLHRSIDGKIKGIHVKRENTGKWFAIFQLEDLPHMLPPTNKAIGIDVGLKHFLTDTDGRQIENPQFYRKTLRKTRVLQRNLTRKKRGSTNRRKAIVRLNRAFEKLTNQRDDFLHKLSCYYVKNYGAIVVEDLPIGNMVKNHNYAKSILDASWGRFFWMLSYKAESAGRTLLRVNPAQTSQLNKDKIDDRDFRGSVNILNRGLLGLGRPLMPVAMRPLLEVPASLVIETGSPILRE